MKKIITFLLIASVVSSPLFSQVELGFHAGAAWSNLHEEQVMDDENIKMVAGDRKPGLTAGFIANIPVHRLFMVQTGLNYIQKKLSITEDWEGYRYTQKVSMHILEVPVQFVYRTRNTEDLNLLLGFGPTFSYAFGGNYNFTGPDMDTTLKISYGSNEDKNDMKSIELGGNILMGVETPKGITISANYNFGFSGLHPSKIKIDNHTMKFNSSYWGVRIGYMLSKKKR